MKKNLSFHFKKKFKKNKFICDYCLTSLQEWAHFCGLLNSTTGPARWVSKCRKTFCFPALFQ